MTAGELRHSICEALSRPGNEGKLKVLGLVSGIPLSKLKRFVYENDDDALDEHDRITLEGLS